MRIWALPAWLVRATVRLMVMALAISSAAPVTHAFDLHDVDCGPALVVHDASQHRITADPHAVTGAAEHCAVCHLARAFSSPRLEVTGTPTLRPGVLFTHAVASVPPAQLDLRLPARAPPSLA